MRNQDIMEFLDQIACDWKVKYQDKIYFFDGWAQRSKSVLHVYIWDALNASGMVDKDITFEAATMDECKRDFLKSPIFDNQTASDGKAA